VDWAVVTPDLGAVQPGLARAVTALEAHPSLRPQLLALQAAAGEALGISPRALAAGGAPGHPAPTGGAIVYARRVVGRERPVHVVWLPSANLARTLEGLAAAIRPGDHRPAPEVETTSYGGEPLLRLDRRFTCGVRSGFGVCADVHPPVFARLVDVAPGASLWPLVNVAPGPCLAVQVGVFLGARWGPARRLSGLAQGLVGVPPEGLWLGASARRHLELHALALYPPGVVPGRLPPPTSPPGNAALAAARGASLVARLRLDPARLLAAIERLLAPLLPDVVARLERQGLPLGRLAREGLTGELVILSEASGLAAVLGVQGAAPARSLLQSLDLVLTAQLRRWQPRLREQGTGWDLQYHRSLTADPPVSALELTFPRGPGSPLPLIPTGRLSVHWGATARHLVVATDPQLFEKVLQLAAEPDQRFLKDAAHDAVRQAFVRDTAISVWAEPDDPLVVLPAAQAAHVARALPQTLPTPGGWSDALRAVADLLVGATLAVERHPAGLVLSLHLALPRDAGSVDLVAPRYLEAVLHRLGGDREGYRKRLQALAQEARPSAVGEKASRVLGGADGVLHRGLLGLLATAYLPWRESERAAAVTELAEADLGRLRTALTAVLRARGPRPTGPWFDDLPSTPLTPTRTCCSGPDGACRSGPEVWQAQPWSTLGFTRLGRHLTQYQLSFTELPGRVSLLLRATWDRDCDGRAAVLDAPGTWYRATGELRWGPLRRTRPDG
jgi:hypothetical protein